MALEVEHGMTDGISVPYAPIFDEVRVNRGFIDTRGKPEVAAKIAETATSPELRRLLVELASEGRLFSIGCDLGQHVDFERKSIRRCVAGGYIQVAFMNYSSASTSEYDGLANAIERVVRSMSDRSSWSLRLMGCFFDFRFPNEPLARAPSLWIWFYARAKRERQAVQEREALIRALTSSLAGWPPSA